MRVAITGGIAEGKSTVLANLHSLGYSTASADEMAREVFAREDVQAQLAASTGLAAPLSPAGLREAISKEPDLRRAVNAIMHPLVHDLLETSVADFIEVPLLFEACIYGLFDRVWVVTCGESEQRRRLLERYGDDAIIATQIASRAKTAFSDRIIRTNQPPETVSRLLSEAVTALYGSQVARKG